MEDALFDALFRAHLAGAYLAMGLQPPAELDEPVYAHKPTAEATITAPYGFIRPQIGGNRFYDWQGAGRYRVPRGAAMADTPLVQAIVFGFDRSTLFLKLEPSDGRAAELAAARLEIDIAVAAASGGPQRHVPVVSRAGSLSIDGLPGGRNAHGRTVELALPFAQLGAQPDDKLHLTFRLVDAASEAPLARHPADGALTVSVPGDGFEAENWSA
jgi:hypothetical protein